jgi:steroid 5-alpha reductase family enzyme
MAAALVVFVFLLYIPAPYGKFFREGWGRCFKAEYAWLIMESPAVMFMAIFFLKGEAYRNSVLVVFFLLWQIHYVHRTFIYPFTMRSRNKNFPVMLVVFAILFNVINGYINGYRVFHSNKIYEISWLADVRFVAGVFLFILGFIINKQSDRILRELRKPGDFSYKIPKRGLFRYISSPHYFGEILEWSGWALLTWSYCGLAFALFTLGNLFPRALSHHAWYREYFSHYPKNRKAIIPFIV